ncbi:MAG: DNA polymerase III subunit gamma/tau [Phycisphaeraceae bacterium]|nr:DNA polymerase III subunit gamma/tau [Phycisphaeraceae bacterium]
MSYTVLARRYRSARFGDVVAQQTIAQTLRNAIEQDRVAHAYLFCGTRGVGKTSMARLFARALNAPDTIDDAPKTPGADYPPEDVQQRMAAAIMTGDDLNVIEIDAASNRSVEEARQLIAGANLSPTGNARYKIYIIDEVHMLTRDAFNTLLKTLEEPPAHVKFILCTTEPHKVLPTIQSRCQRFDFRNIPTPAIAEHLTSVLKKEKIKAEPAAVFHVARLANGSMRDALSLLDRLIATGQSPLTEATIEQMFGLPAADRIMGLISAFAENDVKAALEHIHSLIDSASGGGADQVVDALIEQLRQLMLIGVCGIDSELVELPADGRAAAEKLAAKFDAPALSYMIALCENLQQKSRMSANPRALLDAAIVRLAQAERFADVTALLSGQALPPATSGGKKKVSGEDRVSGVGSRNSGIDNRTDQTPSDPNPDTRHPIPDVSPIPDDPDSLHSALRQRTAGRIDCGWLQFALITAMDETSVTFAAKPGYAHALNNLRGERTLNLITTQLTEILGRRVRVQVQNGSPTSPNHQGNGSNAKTGSDPVLSPDGSPRSIDREALDLPLVRHMLDTFPGAVPLETRNED